MTDSVLVEVDADGVALVTLNEPETRNAWNPGLEARFYAVLAELDADAAVRAAVLTGAGRTFCPGVGMGRLDRVATEGVDFRGRLPFFRTLAFRKLLVAAVNGGCAGAGLAQALMCDLRFASAGAKFSTSFVRRGLPAEHGVSWLLPRQVGLAAATDLLLSGRTVEAPEALVLGLVHRVVDHDEVVAAAVAYAGDVARNCAPEALAVTKAQLLADAHSAGEAAADRAYRVTLALSRRAGFREGISAVVEGRAAEFAGLDPAFDPGEILGAAVVVGDVDPGASHAE